MTEFRKELGHNQTWGKHEVADYYSATDVDDQLASCGLPAIHPGELAYHYALRLRAEREFGIQERLFDVEDLQQSPEQSSLGDNS